MYHFEKFSEKGANNELNVFLWLDFGGFTSAFPRGILLELNNVWNNILWLGHTVKVKNNVRFSGHLAS